MGHRLGGVAPVWRPRAGRDGGAREESRVMQTKMVEAINMVVCIQQRFEGDGMPVRTFDDEPLEVRTV